MSRPDGKGMMSRPDGMEQIEEMSLAHKHRRHGTKRAYKNTSLEYP